MTLEMTSAGSIAPQSSQQWSVLIPTFQPTEEYLRAAIDSVLAEGLAPERMHVQVVDDCTPNVDVAAMVRKHGGTRVEFTRTPRNLGLAGCWNTCVERARGAWVHILHQDDLVFPGFYEQLGQTIAEFPAAGAAFCRHCFLDEQSAWTDLSPIESHHRAILPDWQFKETVGQRIQCAAIVVRRSVYQELGGFRTDLPYCLDWEMWARIAAHYSVAYSPGILAGYRRHDASETSRLKWKPAVIHDRITTFELLRERLPADRAAEATSRFVAGLMPAVMQYVPLWYANGLFDAAESTIQRILRLPVPARERRLLRQMARKIWAKRLLNRIRPTTPSMAKTTDSAAPGRGPA